MLCNPTPMKIALPVTVAFPSLVLVLSLPPVCPPPTRSSPALPPRAISGWDLGTWTGNSVPILLQGAPSHTSCSQSFGGSFAFAGLNTSRALEADAALEAVGTGYGVSAATSRALLASSPSPCHHSLTLSLQGTRPPHTSLHLKAPPSCDHPGDTPPRVQRRAPCNRDLGTQPGKVTPTRHPLPQGRSVGRGEPASGQPISRRH